ncbi:hypothetical protein C7974DRAFT_399942 [Boeremia exigua]|uniref:uncharacterized protein n=1 Tax=Boeremia exigua TaxID=749465 RepID=UPI001E8D0E2C|nr:uncharacterized protein C7974DRAFT_399942 [Boeremia exigua]KAH6620528.1 hypothetical protein C7974DRAFT_399942 [Boeremia exigua]
MADDRQAEVPPSVTDAIPRALSASYSAWRTAAHLYLPFITVALFVILGGPFETVQANIVCVILSAIPTNWLGSFFYPTDRPEPTPKQAVRFSRKWDINRAAILFTYRWLFGRPFDLQFFIADFAMSYGIGSLVGERPTGTKQRRSEFGVHLLWVAASAVSIQLAPSFLTYWLYLVDRALWRAAYIALVDDIVGVLARPNLKTWKGKITLVLTQSFVILFMCWMLLRWKRDFILAYQDDGDYESVVAALQAKVDAAETGGLVEDDGDRFLV